MNKLIPSRKTFSRTRRKFFLRTRGNTKHVMSAPIPGATICHADPMVIEKMNSELRKKCERQRENDMATAIIADKMILL